MICASSYDGQVGERAIKGDGGKRARYRDRNHFPALLLSIFFPPVVRNMFIQVQETPNPNSLKFVPGVQILESGTINFDSAGTSHGSPLAR